MNHRRAVIPADDPLPHPDFLSYNTSGRISPEESRPTDPMEFVVIPPFLIDNNSSVNIVFDNGRTVSTVMLAMVVPLFVANDVCGQIASNESRTASYYEVLEAQQLLYPAEISLSETSRDRRLAIVQLYRALGGGWNFDNTQWTNGRQ